LHSGIIACFQNITYNLLVSEEAALSSKLIRRKK